MIKFITSEKFILPIVYIVIGVIAYSIIKAFINKVSKNKRIGNKKKTIIALVKNIIKYLVMIFIVLAILSVYGVDTRAIVTSIGVVGVIIGLAFQDMVADFLAGVLILFDNHYSIGDVITIDSFTGEVINFGLMTTKIRAATGEVMILANSSFKRVTNYNMHNTTHYITIDVSYDTDIDKLEQTLRAMQKEVEKIVGYVGNYKLMGIQEFASSSIKYMVMLECISSQRFQVKRDFNMILKRHLDKAKIEIPYTKVDVNIRGKYE